MTSSLVRGLTRCISVISMSSPSSISSAMRCSGHVRENWLPEEVLASELWKPVSISILSAVSGSLIYILENCDSMSSMSISSLLSLQFREFSLLCDYQLLSLKLACCLFRPKYVGSREEEPCRFVQANILFYEDYLNIRKI